MKLLIFLSLIAVSQVTHINYRTLTYEDFKGHGVLAALTTTEISLIDNGSGGRHRFYVECYFIPSESYINVKTPAILSHENLHFQVSHNFAHKLKEVIQRFQDCDSLTAIAIHSYYDQQMIAWQKEQQEYDSCTRHGIDTTAQRTWQLRIQNELKQ